MMHFFTIGFLDPVAVSRREVAPRAALNDEVLALVGSFVDADGTLGGRLLEVSESTIRCVWYAPACNRRAEEFAIAAARCGCVVADIEHGRVVDIEALERQRTIP